jgi:hypothetical protein
MSRTFISAKLKKFAPGGGVELQQRQANKMKQLLMISGSQENDYLVMFQTMITVED